MGKDPTERLLPRYSAGVWLGAGALLAVVAFNSAVSLRATKTLLERNQMVEHTRTVSGELDATMTAMLDMETGERGYLYTGQRRYLEPYERSQPEIGRHLDRLAELTADNPVQQRNLMQLRPAAQDVMEVFERAVALEAAGEHEGAKQFVLTADAKRKMDAVRRVLDTMKAEETRALADRSAEARQSERYLLLAIPASHAFTALLLILGGLLVSRDLRKRAETARRLQELAKREHKARQEAETAHQRTESVLSGISEMFILLDRHWTIAYVNEQTVRLTGKAREALLGEQYWKAFPGSGRTNVEEAFRRSLGTQKPEALDVFDGELRKWFSVHLYPSPEGLTVFAQDITEIKQTQEALVRTEKLAAVGRMAAAVAHEINNPLAAVTNLIWIARNDPSASDAVRKHLAIADEELRRVAHVTKRTLGFYRGAAGPVHVKLQDIMKNVFELYASRITSRQLSIRTDYDDGQVFGYAGELRQLFSNLFANALDALPMRGTLAVKISRSRAWTVPSEAGVRVTIADNGCGIPAEHLEHLFEPFFTTKHSTGTGLGLWIAKQITEKHGGRIIVRSNAKTTRNYTVVSVFLPAKAAERQELAAAG